MSEWKELNLGELLQTKGYIRGPFGSSLKRNEMKEEGVPVYEQRNAIYNERIFRFFIDDTKYQELKRFQVKTNDLIISCSGTVGKVSVIMEDDPKGIISQALLILRPDTKKVVLQFLYYFLTSKKGYELITQASHGSVQVNIAERKVVESIPILLPPLPEQQAIAEVLSSLDDKIDLLHRQNKTLEQLAETLFRQWFVEEADESWEVGTISSIIEIQSGFAFKSTEFVEQGRYKLITIKNVQDGYLDLSKTDKLYQLPKRMPHYCLLNKGDILLSLTGNVGRCCLVEESDLLLNQRVANLRARIDRDWAFTYIMFRRNSMRKTLEELAKGTAQANLSPIETGNIELQIPPENLLSKYSDIATPMITNVLQNKIQIRTLTQLRDSLLPKLMSGEIKIEMN
jgi:type I restriction enzyme S subunit